jgi:hypothetical protein
VAMVDAYVDTIGTASDRNFDKWLIHGLYVWPNVFVGNSYNEDVNFMKNWILSRAEWLDDNIPGSCIQTGTDNPELPSFMITVRPNPSFGQIHLEIRNPDRMQLRIEVLNITGNIVYVEDIRGDLMISRNIRLRSGIYLVRSGNGNEYQTVKAVVQ